MAAGLKTKVDSRRESMTPGNEIAFILSNTSGRKRWWKMGSRPHQKPGGTAEIDLDACVVRRNERCKTEEDAFGNKILDGNDPEVVSRWRRFPNGE